MRDTMLGMTIVEILLLVLNYMDSNFVKSRLELRGVSKHLGQFQLGIFVILPGFGESLLSEKWVMTVHVPLYTFSFEEDPEFVNLIVFISSLLHDSGFDISSLQIFTPYELDCLLCGRREIMWELLEIMGEFTPEQQWAFCQFVTGAPRLPPGGLSVSNYIATKIKQSMYVVDLFLERSFDTDFTEARRPAEI
ncbi:hypothetical protein F8388_003322 [Cannabis sativa]|uniref:HECT domain-containing protein n=1 Tax=Cannabis sativa TaxID=3483 RepID=A0A7J6EFE1_CANSA|nr:hypothetical protein F8388_003322 [Cannabis sativa]